MSTKLLIAYVAVAILAVLGLAGGVYVAYFATPAASDTPVSEPIVSIGVLRSATFTYPQEGAFAITDDLTGREYRLRSKDVVLSQYVGKKVAVTGLPERWGESNVIEVQRLEVLDGSGGSAGSVFAERTLATYRLAMQLPTTWTERQAGDTLQLLNGDAIQLQINKQPLALPAADFAAELARTWQVERVPVQGGEAALLIQLGSGQRAFIPFPAEKELIVISIEKAAADAWPRIAAGLRAVAPEKPAETPTTPASGTETTPGTPTTSTSEAGSTPATGTGSTTGATTQPSTPATPTTPTTPVTSIPEPEPSAITFPPSHFDGWRVFSPASRSYSVYIHPSWYWAGAGEGDGYLYHLVMAAGSDLANPDMMVGDIAGAAPTSTNATIGSKQVAASESDGWLRWRFSLGGRTIEVRARPAYRSMAEAVIFRME